jgi:hypothetical protein
MQNGAFFTHRSEALKPTATAIYEERSMPKYRRADTPVASERGTIKGTAWSHLIHAHHYRSESNKNVGTESVDGFFNRFYTLQVIACFAFSTWFMWFFNNDIFAVIFGWFTLRWTWAFLFGWERTGKGQRERT